MTRKFFALFAMLLVGLSLHAQVDTVANNAYYAPPPVDDTWKDGDSFFKPTIGLGAGMFTFYGDYSGLKKYRTNHPLTSRLGYDLRVTQPILPWLDGNFYVLWGTIGANERSLDRNLNFESRVTIGGMNVAVKFGDIINKTPKRDRVFEPYFSLGFESVEFLSKTDLIDAYGNTYHYWNDGSIRNIAEDAPNASEAVRIQRDFVYESDVRELNLDGFGKYPERTFAVPMGIGAQLHVSPKFKFRFGTALHYTFTDLIDGVSDESIGTRQGDSRNDMFVFTSFNISYNLVAGIHSKSKWPDDMFEGADFVDLENDDTDMDGVVDLEDMCEDTDPGVEVDEEGCPKDEDGDGVPDYMDDEPGTPKGAIVDDRGRELTEAMILARMAAQTDSTGGPMKYVTTTYVAGQTNRKAGPGYYVKIDEFVGRVPGDFADVLLSIDGLEIIQKGDTSMFVIGNISSLDEAVQRKLALIQANLISPDEQGSGIYAGVPSSGADPFGYTLVSENDLPNVEAQANPAFDPNKTLYRVQIGAFGKRLNKNVFSEVPDVIGITGPDGITRYMSGSFDNFQAAANRKIDLVSKGFGGAFIVPFRGGKRIRLEDTEATMAKDYDPNAPKSVTGVNPELVRFRVQIGAYNTDIPTDVLDRYMQLGNVEGRIQGDGMTKYVVGSFDSYDAALNFRQEVLNQGFDGAFVVGEFENKIISSREAIQLLK